MNSSVFERPIIGEWKRARILKLGDRLMQVNLGVLHLSHPVVTGNQATVDRKLRNGNQDLFHSNQWDPASIHYVHIATHK